MATKKKKTSKSSASKSGVVISTWPVWAVRVPGKLSLQMRMDALVYEMDQGELLVQMYNFCKKNGFYEALKNSEISNF